MKGLGAAERFGLLFLGELDGDVPIEGLLGELRGEARGDRAFLGADHRVAGAAHIPCDRDEATERQPHVVADAGGNVEHLGVQPVDALLCRRD